MSDEIRQPRRIHALPLCQPRVLALGCGALQPSCRAKPGSVPCFTRLIAPDTLMASVAANGGCRPFAAHFFAGHGVTLRRTLRAWLRMRIRVAVLCLLPLLRASHVRMAQLTRFAFQRSAVIRMTNLCDGISKGSAAACYTSLQVCFVCIRSNLQAPLLPPSLAFSFFCFHQKLYSPLPKSQQRFTTRFCPTPPTVEAMQRFPHSAVHSILAQLQLPTFLQGFPPTTSSNGFISP